MSKNIFKNINYGLPATQVLFVREIPVDRYFKYFNNFISRAVIEKYNEGILGRSQLSMAVNIYINYLKKKFDSQ